MITDLLRLQLDDLKQQGLYRSRSIVDERVTGVNFSSNDYLSLRNDANVRRAFERGFAKYPAGSGASMVVCGYHAIHQELEQTFAKLLGVDDALLFNSGYAANLGVVALLARLNCHLLIDKAAHASVYDGIKLVNATYSRFLHNNLVDLSQKIEAHSSAQALLTESIFSMSGQQPDLIEITNLCQAYKTACIVDEAHAFGVLGPHGLGAVAQNELNQEDIPIRIITFGKAMGSQGAIIAGRADWIEGLFQTARAHLYSTAMSPAIAYGLLESLSIVIEADDERQKLHHLIVYFQQAIKKSPLCWRNSHSPIQQLQLGCPHKALQYAAYLKKQGINCLPMREPTVCLRETGLRVVLNAHHEPQDIDNLFKHLHQLTYESKH